MITPDMTITLHPIETLPPLPPMPLVSSYPNKRRSEAAAVDLTGAMLKKSASIPTELSELAATHQLVRTVCSVLYSTPPLARTYLQQSHTLTSTAKILTLELSSDESKLFTGGQDGDITIWRLDTYQYVQRCYMLVESS